VLLLEITKAVIPAAGLGTRFLPVTKSMPKEMLPVVHKPVIQYVIEEAYQSGITDLLIITGKGKRALEDYLDKTNQTEHNKYLDYLIRILDDLNIYFVRQNEVRGLGDAIRYAESFVAGDPFAIMLGDTITIPPCIHELMSVYQKYEAPVIAVERVHREMVDHYGIIAGSEVERDTFLIEDLVEKPSPDSAPSDLAILGSYIMVPEIFDAIRQTSPGKNDEIQLTDSMKILNSKKEIYAHLFTGKRYDIGNKLDWLKANIELGIQDDELGEDIDHFVRTLIRKRS
jgi:UTP--glucose-1-phosphate uridylyltransferase